MTSYLLCFSVSFTIVCILTILFLRFSRWNKKKILHYQRSYVPTDSRPSIMPFGGIFMFAGLNVALLFAYYFQKDFVLDSYYIIFLPLSLAMFNFLLGLVDDFKKLYDSNNKATVKTVERSESLEQDPTSTAITTKPKSKKFGLTIKLRLIGQFAITMFFVYWTQDFQLMSGVNIIIPFTGTIISFKIPLVLTLLLETIAIIATVNAFNLSDGIDGLLAKQSIAICIFLLFFGFFFAADFVILSLFVIALLGALFAFLLFNSYPAKIFMGDAGSTMLGSAIASLFVIYGIEINLIIIGIVVATELVTSAIQIFSIRTFKKKIFKMAPIHHHFQLSGVNSQKIVEVMFIITSTLVTIYILSFF